MTNIIFKNLGNRTDYTVCAENGQSLMEAALINSVPGIVAECGGACACATCHVYIDDHWLERLNEPDMMEEDMLDFAYETRKNSRLACQVVVTPELEGMIVYIPETQG